MKNIILVIMLVLITGISIYSFVEISNLKEDIKSIEKPISKTQSIHPFEKNNRVGDIDQQKEEIYIAPQLEETTVPESKVDIDSVVFTDTLPESMSGIEI
jgi:hypothetical protein